MAFDLYKDILGGLNKPKANFGMSDNRPSTAAFTNMNSDWTRMLHSVDYTQSGRIDDIINKIDSDWKTYQRKHGDAAITFQESYDLAMEAANLYKDNSISYAQDKILFDGHYQEVRNLVNFSIANDSDKQIIRNRVLGSLSTDEMQKITGGAAEGSDEYKNAIDGYFAGFDDDRWTKEVNTYMAGEIKNASNAIKTFEDKYLRPANIFSQVPQSDGSFELTQHNPYYSTNALPFDFYEQDGLNVNFQELSIMTDYLKNEYRKNNFEQTYQFETYEKNALGELVPVLKSVSTPINNKERDRLELFWSDPDYTVDTFMREENAYELSKMSAQTNAAANAQHVYRNLLQPNKHRISTYFNVGFSMYYMKNGSYQSGTSNVPVQGKVDEWGNVVKSGAGKGENFWQPVEGYGGLLYAKKYDSNGNSIVNPDDFVVVVSSEEDAERLYNWDFDNKPNNHLKQAYNNLREAEIRGNMPHWISMNNQEQEHTLTKSYESIMIENADYLNQMVNHSGKFMNSASEGTYDLETGAFLPAGERVPPHDAVQQNGDPFAVYDINTVEKINAALNYVPTTDPSGRLSTQISGTEPITVTGTQGQNIKQQYSYNVNTKEGEDLFAGYLNLGSGSEPGYSKINADFNFSDELAIKLENGQLQGGVDYPFEYQQVYGDNTFESQYAAMERINPIMDSISSIYEDELFLNMVDNGEIVDTGKFGIMLEIIEDDYYYRGSHPNSSTAKARKKKAEKEINKAVQEGRLTQNDVDLYHRYRLGILKELGLYDFKTAVNDEYWKTESNKNFMSYNQEAGKTSDGNKQSVNGYIKDIYDMFNISLKYGKDEQKIVADEILNFMLDYDIPNRKEFKTIVKDIEGIFESDVKNAISNVNSAAISATSSYNRKWKQDHNGEDFSVDFSQPISEEQYNFILKAKSSFAGYGADMDKLFTKNTDNTYTLNLEYLKEEKPRYFEFDLSKSLNPEDGTEFFKNQYDMLMGDKKFGIPMSAPASGQTTSLGQNPATGSKDYGSMQINSYYQDEDAQTKVWGKYIPPENMSHTQNLQYAVALQKYDGNWNAWEAYKNGAYNDFLNYSDDDYLNAGADKSVLTWINNKDNHQFSDEDIKIFKAIAFAESGMDPKKISEPI